MLLVRPHVKLLFSYFCFVKYGQNYSRQISTTGKTDEHTRWFRVVAFCTRYDGKTARGEGTSKECFILSLPEPGPLTYTLAIKAAGDGAAIIVGGGKIAGIDDELARFHMGTMAKRTELCFRRISMLLALATWGFLAYFSLLSIYRILAICSGQGGLILGVAGALLCPRLVASGIEGLASGSAGD